MTSGIQPPFSGAPTPVQGVTGGPPVLGGQIGNDPTSGNIVVAPNPGNVFQLRKGSTPQSLQVYEYFHTNTDFARVALNSKLGGPFQLSVEVAPTSVTRDLQIITAGAGIIRFNTSGNDQWSLDVNGTLASAGNGSSIPLVVVGNTDGASNYGFQILNHSKTQNNLLIRDDGVATLGRGALIVNPTTTSPGTVSANNPLVSLAGLYLASATPSGVIGGQLGLGTTFVAPGGGPVATLGTVGGTGPVAAAMNSWWRINANNTNFYIPLWV